MKRLLLLLALVLINPLAMAETNAETNPSIPQRQDVVSIRSMSELNKHLEEIAMLDQKTTLCRFEGKLLNKNVKKIIQESLFSNYSSHFSYTQQPDGSLLLKFEYRDNARMLAAHQDSKRRTKLSIEEHKALDEAQRRIAELITPGMSDYEKARVLHDDLIRRCSYSRKAGRNCSYMIRNNKGLSETYSRTMWLLLRMVDIPCLMVCGVAHGPHVWNLAYINGEWHHIDATWDDPYDKSEKTNILRHNYFLINDKEISKDHRWLRSSVPAATTKGAMYYRTRRLYFNTYEKMWEKMAEAIGNGETEFECYLSTFKDRKTFTNSMKEAIAANPKLKAIQTWNLPNSRAGVLRFTFDYSKSRQPAQEQILETATDTIERVQKNWNESDIYSLYQDLDFSDIQHTLDEFGEETEQQLDNATEQTKKKAGELWKQAGDKVNSWF